MDRGVQQFNIINSSKLHQVTVTTDDRNHSLPIQHTYIRQHLMLRGTLSKRLSRNVGPMLDFKYSSDNHATISEIMDN